MSNNDEKTKRMLFRLLEDPDAPEVQSLRAAFREQLKTERGRRWLQEASHYGLRHPRVSLVPFRWNKEKRRDTTMNAQAQNHAQNRIASTLGGLLVVAVLLAAYFVPTYRKAPTRGAQTTRAEQLSRHEPTNDIYGRWTATAGAITELTIGEDGKASGNIRLTITIGKDDKVLQSPGIHPQDHLLEGTVDKRGNIEMRVDNLGPLALGPLEPGGISGQLMMGLNGHLVGTLEFSYSSEDTRHQRYVSGEAPPLQHFIIRVDLTRSANFIK